MKSKRWIVAAIGGLVLVVMLRHLGVAQAESITPSAPESTPVAAPSSISMVELRSTIRGSSWRFQQKKAADHSPHSPSPDTRLAQRPAASPSPAPAAPLKNTADRSAAPSAKPMAEPAEVMIRVAVASVPTSFDIAVRDGGGLTKVDGSPSFSLAPSQSYRIALGRNGLSINQQAIDNGAWLMPGGDGLVWVAGRWYRGRIQIVYDGSRLLAVNWIDLEDYLASVVGSEMPNSWHSEALKAQAIAARSYALAHIARPASAWFDLGDDERWQAYRGVEAESDRTEAAVGETAGQVLVGASGQILESLYASTEHLTRTAHNGIGMSQHGAQQLAVIGQNYSAILLHYYPAAEIAALEVSHDPDS